MKNKFNKFLTLLVVLLFGFGQMWGAAGDATTSNAPKSGGTTKDYANTISVAAGYLDGNVMYYISNNLTFISTDGLEANYLGFVFKPSVDLTIDFEGFNGNSGDVNITYQIDSIADAAFYEVFTEAGSNKISEKIISDNGGESASSTHTVLNYWKDNGVVKYSSKKWQSNGDNAPKNLAGQQNTTFFGNTRLVTDKVVAISSTKSAAAGTYSFMRDATNKFVFKAGKVYRIYSTRGSSKTGYKSFTFTPVYQLTWALDGGSITSSADAYTNAGYYAKGTELTAPTVTKAGADFAGWSPAVAATMPAAATTYTATWATACSAGVPGNVTKGALTAGEITLTAEGSAASGDTWYWQTSESGVDKTNSGSSFVATAAGTYYVRSYNTAADCWNVTAKSIELTAEDFLAHYAITYNKGEYGTGTIAGGEKVEGVAFTLSSERFTRAGYVQTGWSLTDGGTKAYDLGGSYTTDAAKTFYPVWAETSTYVASFTCGATAPAGWTFSNAGTYGDTDATADYVCNFVTAGTSTPKQDPAEGKDGTTDNDVAFAKNTNAIATYDLGAATTVTALNVTLCGGSGSAFNETIEYLGADGSTVKKTYINSLSAGNWNDNLISKNEIVEDVRYIRVHGASKWVAMKAFSVTYVDLVVKYNVTFAAGEGSGSMATLKYAEDANVELPACTFTAPDEDHEFDAWVVTKTVGGASVTVTDGAFTMPAEAVTVTATWKEKEVRYAITEGTPANGTVDADLAEAPAGETVTITATPATDYLFSAWDVYKTGESSVKVAVTETAGVYTFTMPAYAVTVSASFAADSRKKILYVTKTSESDTKANDKLYAALKDDYRIAIVGASSEETLTDYDLVVLHESVDGSSYNATAVAAAKTSSVPVLNTKTYFYNSGRFGWGAPNAGGTVKGATLNSAYCNVASHPIFAGVTISEGFIEITDDAAEKCMQPVAPDSGKEGYTLATAPNNGSGGTTAIQEVPAGDFRGASSGKYLLISVSSAKLNALNANGQKLFQNAAAYLIGSSAWDPIAAPVSPAVTADPSSAYSVGDNIALTASATGVSAATTYTWYKGDTWAEAETAGAIQATATAAAGGNTYGINDCALGDAGIYWCVISNGTDCEASASLAVTVSDASYNVSFSSAHGTAPTATTGVSYTLPELTESGWEHQGWTASVDVTVDAEPVLAGTLIANGKMAVFAADVTFTAVWTQVFDVTFNMQSHGAAIAAQYILDGGKVSEPTDPFVIGWEFGGWYKEAACTNEWDFENDVVTEDTELFAKWTEFTGCVESWPAKSGDAPAVNDVINMQTGSHGATMTALSANLSYTTYGLQFGTNSGTKASVVLTHDMVAGTKISLTLVANGTGARGLHIYDAAGSNKVATLGWSSAANGDEETYTYTVVADDGLDGTNGFQLWRNNTVTLKCMKVESCGDEIIYHNLTSAVNPADKGTVTLSASSVREGRTATATYSDIAAGMEFETWQISGAGASISDASANPAVITMGTADAVVTLKLRAETPKHTVTYDMQGHGVAPADEEVKEGKKVTEPEVAEVEGWIFGGWYKEAGCIHAWNFNSDVMGTSDMTLFAKWTEDTSIRLINKSTGAINTTNFITAVTAATVTYDAVDHHGAAWGGTQGAISGTNRLDKIVQYNATTNQTKLKLSLYNANNSQKYVYIHKILEGETTAVVETLEVASKTPVESEYYTFNDAKNRSFYITTNSTDVKILQVKVVEDGAVTLKRVGEIGYSLNLNKGRVVYTANSAVSFEGLALSSASNYSVISSSEFQTTNNLSFSVAAATTMKLTTNAAKYYVSQNPDEDGTGATAVTTAGTAEFQLTAGTWYIVPSTTSNVKITKIEFTYPRVIIEDDATDAAIIPGADVTVPNGTTLTLSDAHTIHDLKVEDGGKVTLNTGSLTVVGTFSIEATMAAGTSGQLKGATGSNFAAAEAYIDITLGAAGNRNAQWHAFTVPFPVDAINGVYDASTGDKLVNETNYAIMAYHGDVRATGAYGWKKYRKTLVPGTFYIMTVDGERATYRFKKTAGSAIVAENSKAYSAYAASGEGQDTDAGWNGIGNPTLQYGKVNAEVQVLDPASYTFVKKDANSTNFVVGTPFFYQAASDGSMEMLAADAGATYAPARMPAKGVEKIKVAFGNETFTDYLDISASEEATNNYQIGKDLAKMIMTSTPEVAQIYGKAYGTNLCMIHAPMVNDKAEFKATLYVPAAGEYVMSAPATDDADVYLTKDGMIIWNLSMSECTLTLDKGFTTGYGFQLVQKAPAVATGVENTEVLKGAQKVVIDNHVFILRGGQMYDVNGQMVR